MALSTVVELIMQFILVMVWESCVNKCLSLTLSRSSALIGHQDLDALIKAGSIFHRCSLNFVDAT